VNKLTIKSWINSCTQFILSFGVIGLLLVPCAHAAVVGEWDLNEGSGTTAVDSSGNGNNGTLFNGTGQAHFFTDPVNGGGVDLNGTGDYIDFGNSPIWNSVSIPFSLEAWFVIDNRGNKPILGVTEPTPKFALETGNFSGGGLEGAAGFQLYPGSDNFPNNPNHPRVTNVLVHLVGTYDGTNAILYKDGTLGPMSTVPYTNMPLVTTNPLRAGATHSGSGAYAGRIYHLRIHDVALTQAEASANYNEGPNPGGVTVSSTNVVVADTAGVTYSSVVDRVYRLQSTPDLVSSNFSDTGAFAVGDGGGMTLFDPAGTSTSKNYRVQEQP
jgi:hypothetical protein